MSSADRLRSMQQAFQANPKQDGFETRKYYPLGKLDFDQAVTLRFLSDANPDNPWGFLKEIIRHQLVVNGQTKRVPCLSMYGKPCPVCEQARAFYNNNQNELGSQFWQKKNYVAQVLPIDDPLKLELDPQNPIYMIELGKQIFSIIKEAIISGDIENEPDALTGGYNFVIKKTKGGAKKDGSGFYPAYNVGTRFQARPSNVPDALVDIVQSNLINLDTILPREPDIAQIQADLQAALVAAGVNTSHSSAPVRASRPAPAPAVSDDDDGIPFDGGQPVQSARPTATESAKPDLKTSTADLLSKLRNRQG